MSATEELVRFGVFELNLGTEELRKSGAIIRLPPQPFQLLALLARHAGQVVGRDTIQKQLWGVSTEVDSEHGMRQCINQIRTALGDNSDNPVYVETVPCHGYRFLAPVTSQNGRCTAPAGQGIERLRDRERHSVASAGLRGSGYSCGRAGSNGDGASLRNRGYS